MGVLIAWLTHNYKETGLFDKCVKMHQQIFFSAIQTIVFFYIWLYIK